MKFLTVITFLLAFNSSALSQSDVEMDLKLGQIFRVTDSSSLNSVPAASDQTYIVLVGAELYGENQVQLSFKLYFTAEDKKDLKDLTPEETVYTVVVDRTNSISSVEGIQAIERSRSKIHL